MLPKKRFTFDALAGVSSSSGPVLRGELSAHVTDYLGVFGYGQWTPAESSAGIGARVSF